MLKVKAMTIPNETFFLDRKKKINGSIQMMIVGIQPPPGNGDPRPAKTKVVQNIHIYQIHFI